MNLFLLSLAFTGGVILSVYPFRARKKGWHVWRSLRQHGGATTSIGFASMAGAAIMIVLRAEWWEIAVVLGTAVVIGLALIHVLKSTVQPVAVALLGFGWLWFLLTEMHW
ncbi:MAG TPA: hypothetical protein VF190_16010 [Rhodothermales bacterium]